jgi:hypothetical protein
MKCQLCEVRRPRRLCPGVRGEICAPCCGADREVTIACPLDCEYLREARLHENPPEVDPDKFPNSDIRVSDNFLRNNERLLTFAAATLFQVSQQNPDVIDLDMREALGALIRTYRTLESGLIYESRPANPLAAFVQQRFQQALQEHRQHATQSTGITTIRDADVLGILVFLERLELSNNNGRRRGRAFIDFLRGFFPSQPSGPPLITA